MELAVPLSPQNNNTPNQPFLTSTHYREWIRIVRKSSRNWESVFKFIINICVFSFETSSLVFTLFTGLHLSDDRNESIGAIFFYLVTCCVTVAVNFANQRSSRSMKTSAFTLILNILFILKPIRYLKLFLIRNKVRKIINKGHGRDVINERSLKSITKLNAAELEYKRVDLYECFFQGIPMALLQACFLFYTYERFQLCNFKDLARLGAILAPILHSAKSASDFELSTQEYEQALHFLAYYKSRSQHPMVIYETDMLSMRGTLNFLSHFTTILSRVYTTTFFLAVSIPHALAYMLLTFLLNLGLLKLFPNHLLQVLQNAPHGVSTIPSYYTDRFINIFTNVGTRYSKFTDSNVKCIRFPLVLIQLPVFLAPVLLLYSTSFFMTAPTTQIHSTDLNDTLSNCPELASVYERNVVFSKIGDYLFSSYKSVDDRFQTFNDIFGLANMIWLLFYTQVLATILYAFADLMTRRKGERNQVFSNTYPILTGYSFYAVLLNKARRCTVGDLRRLIVLTVLKEGKFYRVMRSCCSWRTTIDDDKVESLQRYLIDKLNVRDGEVEMKINVCIGSGHTFLNDFLTIRDLFARADSDRQQQFDDKKLFLAFFGHFDRKLVQMSSDRVERIFRAMGLDVERAAMEWEDI